MKLEDLFVFLKVNQIIIFLVILRSLINGYTCLLFSRKKILSTHKFSSHKRVGRKRPTVVKMPPYLFIQVYPSIRDLRVHRISGNTAFKICDLNQSTHCIQFTFNGYLRSMAIVMKCKNWHTIKSKIDLGLMYMVLLI